MKVRILVIEDNPADVALLQWALEGAQVDCEMTVIDDGVQAVMLAERRGPYANAPVPDLAILDLNLPGHDGLEVLEALRANSPFADLPIAVLTSTTSMRERASAERFGVQRFLTKPADLDGFLNIGLVVKELINEGRAQRHGGH